MTDEIRKRCDLLLSDGSQHIPDAVWRRNGCNEHDWRRDREVKGQHEDNR